MVLGPQGPGRVGRRRLYVGTGRPSGGPFCVVGLADAGSLAPVQTARLELRPIAEEHVEALADLDARPEVRAAIDPFGEHLPEDRGALRAYEGRLVGDPGFLAAIERRSGALVGWFQFQETDGRPGERELGYRLRPEAWGQGYATEGAAALLREAFARPGIARVYAHSLLDNPAHGPTAGCPGPSTKPWHRPRRTGPERPRAAPLAARIVRGGPPRPLSARRDARCGAAEAPDGA